MTRDQGASRGGNPSMSIVSDQATRPLTKKEQYFVDAQSKWERVEAGKATFGDEGELLAEAYPEMYDA